MNKKVAKLSIVRTIFVGAFKTQVKQEDTLLVAAGIGLGQGLKYNGDLKRGLQAGLVSLAVIATINGVSNVITNWDKLDKIVEELEVEE